MTLVDLGGDGAEPVSIEAAKLWCRIERDDEDTLIGGLIAAARETVERQTGLVLRRRRFRLIVDVVPADRLIRVPYGPAVEIDSIVAYDASGVPTAFQASESAVVGALLAIRVTAALAEAAANGLEIEFEAGFAPADVPQPLTLAIRQIVAAAFEVRGVISLEQQPAFVPASARELINGYREVRL